jgi:hypothetical protein
MDNRFCDRVVVAANGMGECRRIFHTGLCRNADSTTVLRNDSRVFSSVVAAVVMPFAVKALLVIVPAFFGMRWSLRDQPLSVKAAFLWTVALALLTFNDARRCESYRNVGGIQRLETVRTAQ